jgi:hypothetical protein
MKEKNSLMWNYINLFLQIIIKIIV